MDTKRTFVVATDHTRKFEYCVRSHISSPLPVRRRHQIMPSPRSATGPQRPCKRLHSAFSTYICCPGTGVVSNWPPTNWAAHASLGYLPRSCQYRRYVLVPGKHAGTSGRNRRRRRELHAERKAMSSLAPHMEAFLREHL